MKLTDLSPKWILPGQWSEQAAPFYIGVSFLCPHCAAKGVCPTCGHFDGKRLAVMFWPPIDPQQVEHNISAIPHDGFHARASGETFDTLTVTPSIGFEGIGHWHGHITNGETNP